MKSEPMIINVGREKITSHLTIEIAKGRCINCDQAYNSKKRLTFVILHTGQIIWWHRQGFCKHTKK